MPTTKVAKKKLAKEMRTIARRRRRYRPNPTTTLYLKGVPRKAIVTLKYCDTFHGASAIGSPYQQIFKANSLYDPDATGTGHQPYLLDQLCGGVSTSFFSYYQVNKCKIIIEGSANSAGTGCAQVGIWSTRKSSSSYTTPWQLAEQGNRKEMKCKFVADDTSKFKLSLTQYPRQTMGISRGEYNDITYQSIYSADPSTLTYFWFIGAHPDNSTVVTFDFVVTMIYYAQLFNQNQLPQS